MNNEVWKDVVGFEDYYKVSNYGNVRSVGRYVNSKPGFVRMRREKIIASCVMPVGYYRVGLWKDGKSIGCFNHRLVAQAFIPNPENKSTVNHIDGDKLNNHVDNLEWCTQSENIEHAVRTGLMPKGESVSSSKLTEEHVGAIRLLIQNGYSFSKLGRIFGVDETTIASIGNQRTWKQSAP